MREIFVNSKVNGNKIVEVDDDDFEKLNKIRWYIIKACNTFYAVGNYNARMHRIIMGLNSNNNLVIDHIDGNGLNNQKSNLRICMTRENGKNIRVDNKGTLNSISKYKGVRWHKHNALWNARIMVDGKRIDLGGFGDEVEAAYAYNIAAIEYHGEFANLNKLPDDFASTHIKRFPKSKYIGVTVKNNKFIAQICISKKNSHLGVFDIEEDAAKAYDLQIIKFNLNMKLNFPNLLNEYKNLLEQNNAECKNDE